MPYSVEICAGAGGQALGLEMAGFNHAALVEIERPACDTLLLNRPKWNVTCGDIRSFSGTKYKGIDLLAGGVPCPPFSKAGKQLGSDDERDLFPEAIRLADEIRPRAIMLENVRGMLDAVFEDYRKHIKNQLASLGYHTEWRLHNASDYGVSQLRPRVIFVALQKDFAEHFTWPIPAMTSPPTVGELLFDLMSEQEWRGATNWRERANEIAPTLVGGSKKHGGPDLGPTRAKKAWANLGVDGHGLADNAPERIRGGGMFSISILDKSGRTALFSTQAFISMLPNQSFGNAVNTQDWQVILPYSDWHIGGNTKAGAEVQAVLAALGYTLDEDWIIN